MKDNTKEKIKKDKTVKVKGAKPQAGEQEFSIPVYDVKGKETGTFVFDKKIFNGEVKTKVIYQAVLMYNANRRQGNASTKTRGDISGGGKKPFRQKGTGRARAGSTRSPLWRHGGVIFGPHPRDYHYDIPKQVKRLAFLYSINSKLNDKKVLGIDSVTLTEPKTKNFASILKALKLTSKILFVLDSFDKNLMLASRNIDSLNVKNYKDFNTMDVLNSDTMVMSKAALEKLPERFKE